MYGSDSTPPLATVGGATSPVVRKRMSPWVAWIVGGLLAVYATLAFTASMRKGLSFDEGLQLAMGYNIWLNDDFRLEGANGDFIKRWATLPYLITRPNLPTRDDPAWREIDAYGFGRKLFFELGNKPEALLMQARAMMVLLGIILGLLIFRCGKELFGPAGGIIALAMFCFSSSHLAFAGIVSTDMSIVLTMLASTYCIWRLLHRVTLARVVVSGVVFGLLLLAKMTALIIFPITAVLVAIKLIVGRPLVVHWARDWVIEARHRQLAVIAGLVLAHAVAGWTVLWAHYGFRYSSLPAARGPGVEATIPVMPYSGDGTPGHFAGFIDWSRRTQFLPESYLNGVQLLLGYDDRLQAFMNGKMKFGGWRSFFPYTIWVKTHPSLFVLLLLGALGAGYAFRARRSELPELRDEGAFRPNRLYRAVPYIVLIVVYLGVAVLQNINLGHRHVLPIYPALYILAGAVTLVWARWPGWSHAAVALLLAWRASDAFATHPNYLSYFAPQVGGAEKGYQHLVDSSLDWGMNLPNLKRWIDEHDPLYQEPLFLAYFGTDSPEYYGIRSTRLPGFFDWRKQPPYAMAPGYYAISATLFQGVYLVAYGPWTVQYEQLYQEKLANVRKLEAAGGDAAKLEELFKVAPAEFWQNEYLQYDHLRFARLCAWLRKKRPPEDNVGNAIFIWKLTAADLEAALMGPPAELETVSPRHPGAGQRPGN